MSRSAHSAPTTAFPESGPRAGHPGSLTLGGAASFSSRTVKDPGSPLTLRPGTRLGESSGVNDLAFQIKKLGIPYQWHQ